MPLFHASSFRRLRSKRLFVPALISLSLLSLLFLRIIVNHPGLKQYYAMEVVAPTLKEIDEMSPKAKRYLETRNYLAIKLNGNEAADYAKVEFIKYQLKQLIEEKDTVNGVHLSFGDEAKYESLVRALAICNEASREHKIIFAFYDTGLWILHRRLNPEPTTLSLSVCGGVHYSKPERWESLTDEKSLWLKTLLNTSANFWPSLAAFIVLLFINGWAMVKRIRLAKASY